MKLGVLQCGAAALFLATQSYATGAWEARHGLTADKYNSKASELAGKGYQLNYVSGYTQKNESRYAAVWEKRSETPKQQERVGVSSIELDGFIQKMDPKTYSPVLLNSYTVDDTTEYASIWSQKEMGEFEFVRGMSVQSFQEHFDNLLEKGYVLNQITAYVDWCTNEPMYGGIFEKRKSPAWEARAELSNDKFQETFDYFKGKGYRLVSVDGYSIGDEEIFAGVWEKSSEGPAPITRYSMTSEEYQQRFNEMLDQSYMPTVVNGYAFGDSVRYVAIFNKFNFD